MAVVDQAYNELKRYNLAEIYDANSREAKPKKDAVAVIERDTNSSSSRAITRKSTDREDATPSGPPKSRE